MKKKLKIAMFFSSDPSQAGGVQEHILYLSKYLRKKGHKVDIYGPDKNIHLFKNYFSISKVIKLTLPNGNITNITTDLTPTSDTLEKLNFNRYNFVHIHEPYIPFIGWELIKNVKKPKISTFHTAWDDDSIINFINPFISLFKDNFSSNFQAAIFVSKMVQKRWQYLCKRNVIKKVIYNGVDAIYKPVNKSESKTFKILFVGRLVKRKGLIYLLKAVKHIVKIHSNIIVDVIGDGPLKLDLKKYVRKNKLKNYVFFHGQVFGKKKIEYYQKSHLFCAPYVDEAFGLTILEAMATGTPIIGFKNGAFKEILSDYPDKKLLVKSKKVDLLSKVIVDIMLDKNSRQKIFDWSIKKSKEFDWKKIADDTEKVYFQVLNKNEKYS